MKGLRVNIQLRAIVAGLSIASLGLGLLPVGVVAQTDSPLLQSLRRVEETLYGKELPGALVDRLSQVERDVFGETSPGSIIDRLAKVAAFLGESMREGPSLAFNLKAVEWNLHRSVGSEPLFVKLDRLEKLVTGVPGKGSIVSRVEDLVKVCLPAGTLSTKLATVRRGTPVKVRLLNTLNSATTQKGERVEFEVAQDVILDNVLVIPRGSKGSGVVSKVITAGKMGRDGKVELEVKEIKAFDGTTIALGLDEDAKRMNESLQIAVGASIAGFVIFGPIGALGGFFVEGKDVSVPAGTEIYVGVRNDAEVLGLVVPGSASGSPAPALPVVELKPGSK